MIMVMSIMIMLPLCQFLSSYASLFSSYVRCTRQTSDRQTSDKSIIIFDPACLSHFLARSLLLSIWQRTFLLCMKLCPKVPLPPALPQSQNRKRCAWNVCSERGRGGRREHGDQRHIGERTKSAARRPVGQQRHVRSVVHSDRVGQPPRQCPLQRRTRPRYACSFLRTAAL